MDDPQQRIDSALRELPEESATNRFSDYRDTAIDITRRLMAAARQGGVDAALDEFDRLRESEDHGRLRRALQEFVTHDPAAAGLQVPPLEERAPWKVRPSRKEEER